jgi:hypothetical protein
MFSLSVQTVKSLTDMVSIIIFRQGIILLEQAVE